MAQTVEQLKNQYDTFGAEIQEIDQVLTDEISDADIGATSVSKVAEWRLLRMVWTVMSFLQQSVFDLFKTEVQAIADSSAKMTSRWLASEVKIFQYDDPILFNEDTRKYYYAEVDEDKQIIDRVAVVDQSGLSTVKVAKSGPVALSTDELNAFKSFVRQIQPTGANISLVSLNADEIHLPIEVTYDPIVPLATLKANVETAVNTYISELNFNGTFYTIKLVDAIQAVEGVIDVEPGELKAAPNGTDPTGEDAFDRKYQPLSGYLDIYDDSPLADVITYSAQ